MADIKGTVKVTIENLDELKDLVETLQRLVKRAERASATLRREEDRKRSETEARVQPRHWDQSYVYGDDVVTTDIADRVARAPWVVPPPEAVRAREVEEREAYRRAMMLPPPTPVSAEKLRAIELVNEQLRNGTVRVPPPPPARLDEWHIGLGKRAICAPVVVDPAHWREHGESAVATAPPVSRGRTIYCDSGEGDD